MFFSTSSAFIPLPHWSERKCTHSVQMHSLDEPLSMSIVCICHSRYECMGLHEFAFFSLSFITHSKLRIYIITVWDSNTCVWNAWRNNANARATGFVDEPWLSIYVYLDDKASNPNARVTINIILYNLFSVCSPTRQPTDRSNHEREERNNFMMKTFPILCFAFVWVLFRIFFSLSLCANAIVSTCAFVVTVCTPLRRFTRVHRRSENNRGKNSFFFFGFFGCFSFGRSVGR